MCVLQPRQLFARAAHALANKLPAECVLRTPEDGASSLIFSQLFPLPISWQCHHLLSHPVCWGVRSVRASLGDMRA